MSYLQTYLEEFDVRLSKTNLSEAQAMSHFLGGLREKVEISVRSFNPTTLEVAYALAKVHEVLLFKKHHSEKREQS